MVWNGTYWPEGTSVAARAPLGSTPENGAAGSYSGPGGGQDPQLHPEQEVALGFV